MITSTDTKIIYDGDGITTAFPYVFGIINPSDVSVIRIDSDGSEHLLTADYYVDVANGNVNYPGYAPGGAPPIEDQPPVLPVDSKLCIYRSIPQNQLLDLPATYPLNTIEAALDKLTMLLQEVSEAIGRSIKLSIGNGDDIDMVLPVEPGKTFKWAADGKSLVLTDDPAVVYEVAVNLYAAVQAAISATESARDAAVLARETANTSAINAGLSADAAEESATSAAGHEANALSYKNVAQTFATNAGNSEAAVHEDAVAAALSESNALGYKNAAQTSASNAATSESNALGYKNAALSFAMDAAAYKGNALSYKNAAQASAEAAAASAAQAEQWAAVIDPDAYEPAYGSPDVDGKVLSSTASGERSWIFPTADLSNYYTKTQTNALIPTTLPASDVSAWAKAATKPSYTYSEVGAAAAAHGHTVSQISDFPTSMPASDVSAWAKAANKPTYTASEVGLGNVTNESKETMFTDPTFTGKTTANVVEVKQALGTISTNTTINTASGDIVTATLGAAITIGITANASTSTCRVCTLILTNGGAYTITWNSAIKWAGGTAPTLSASGVDILHFMTVDNGTTWLGCLGGKGFA